jgi:hypothetical protein
MFSNVLPCKGVAGGVVTGGDQGRKLWLRGCNAKRCEKCQHFDDFDENNRTAN